MPSAVMRSGRAIVAFVLMMAAYFLIPVDPGIDTYELVTRTIMSAVGIIVAARLVNRQVRRHLESDESPLFGLIVAIVAAVLFFALLDYVVAISFPDQFVGLTTRIDALYFALSTLATVGFGDVHAEGQLARVMVCIQLVFNVVVIASAASILSRQLDRRIRARRSQPPDLGATDAKP